MSPRARKHNFYLDENFPIYGDHFLRSKGHKVFCAISVNKKLGLSDEFHVKRSFKLKSVLLTLDKDFKTRDSLRVLATKSYGVIVISINLPNQRDIERILSRMLDFLSKNQMNHRLCVINQENITLFD